MSSLRNAIPRRSHKERSQPQRRQHLGFLEKKKDFKERSKDYRKKREKLKKLKLQIAFKNPEQFNKEMTKLKRVDGGHKSIDDIQPDKAFILDVKSQDMKYLLMKKSSEKKKINRLRSSLQILTENIPVERNHTIFVDNEEELEKFDPLEYFDTTEECLNRSYNRPIKSTLSEGSLIANSHFVQPELIPKLDRSRAKAYRELVQRLERDKQLKTATEDLYIQQQVIKSETDTVRRITKKHEDDKQRYKWTAERKK